MQKRITKPTAHSRTQTYNRSQTPTFRGTSKTHSNTSVNNAGTVYVNEDFDGTYGVGDHRVPATMTTSMSTQPNGRVNTDTLIYIKNPYSKDITAQGGRRQGSTYTPGVRVEEATWRDYAKKLPLVGKFFSNGGTIQRIEYFK